MRSLGLATLLCVVAAFAAGCGDADESTGTTGGPAATAPGTSDPVATTPGEEAITAAALDGRSFDVTTLAGRRPVARSGAGIAFEDSRLAVTTGCNGLSGSYEITADGRLRSPDLVQTQMACEPALMRQEDALRAFLESQPHVALSGESLTLTGPDGTELVLAESARAPGPRPIAGTSWTLETIAGSGPDGSASNVPAGVRAPTLLIAEDGTVELFAGCNRGGGRAVVRDDGFVDFGPIALTRMACDRAAMAVEAAVTSILSGRVAAGYSGQGDLVLSKRGRSLTFTPGG
jgi:heat shock protein HslJ